MDPGKLLLSIPSLFVGLTQQRILPQFSSAAEDGPDEWVTEGIQIGEVTSVMGILGMWTGAQHARMDPLGMYYNSNYLITFLLNEQHRSFLGLEGVLIMN